MKSICVATCQFSVEPEIDYNRRCVLRQVTSAAEQGADVIHFSECALSGYAGVDIPDTRTIDWDALTDATQQIMEAAKRSRVWILLGSTHRLSDRNRPHNCVYVINPRGKIVDRYDKRFCTGLDGKRPTMDLKHYSPGDRFVTFRVKGVTCGVLICYDYRFPELYREYKKLGVDVILQSFHNARSTVVEDNSYNIWRTIVPATMSCRAAENHFWVSANNSQAPPVSLGLVRCQAGRSNRRSASTAHGGRACDGHVPRSEVLRRAGPVAPGRDVWSAQQRRCCVRPAFGRCDVSLTVDSVFRPRIPKDVTGVTRFP